jgi:aryl-alcohol dehydrogenase-like predicted oxidoreductase
LDKSTLGRTGLEVTAVGLGCGGFSKLGMFTKGIDNAAQIVRKAFEYGVNFFDTASVYGTQPAVGKGLEGISRPSYIISSKFLYNSPDGSIKHPSELENCLDQCLKELNTDYIDIYNLHAVTP